MAEHEKNTLEAETVRLLSESLGIDQASTAEHPEPEDLAAYQEGALDPPARDAVRRHLVLCDDCAAILLDLARRDETLDSETHGPSEHELERAWRRQKELLVREGLPLTTPAREQTTDDMATITTLPRWLRSAAAVLFAALAGLGFWVVSLQDDLEALRRLQTNPPLANLEPVDSSRRSASELPVLALGDETARGWLILNLAGPLEGSSFRAELYDTAGERLLTLDPLERTEAGNFRMEISRQYLPTGEIRILLLERSPGDAEPLAEYRFRLSAL